MPGIVVASGTAWLIALGHSNSHHEFPSLSSTAASLATPTIGGALVLVFAVVLSTVMTQAFEFEMIKVLEGYWSDRWFSRALRRRRVARLAEKGVELNELVKQLEHRAKKASLARLSGGDKALKRRLRARVRATRREERLETDAEADFLLASWRTAAEPAAIRRLEAVERAVRNYPAPHRTMPTRLGNTLRASEDRMNLDDGGDLEGFILRNYDVLPERLTTQVSDFRTRLNMYCTLVLAWVLLALVAIPSTWHFSGLWHITTCASVLLCLGLARTSYAAAISSARGYGAALLAADTQVTSKAKKVLATSDGLSGGGDTAPGA